MSNAYTPRPGTKVATATEALKNGPMTTSQLSKLLDVPSGNVGANLQTAIAAGFIIRLKDESELLHFALASKDIPDGFAACDGSTGSKTETAARTFNPADPFGLAGKTQKASSAHTTQEDAPPPNASRDQKIAAQTGDRRKATQVANISALHARRRHLIHVGRRSANHSLARRQPGRFRQRQHHRPAARPGASTARVRRTDPCLITDPVH